MLPQWSSVRVTLTAQLTLPLIIHRYGFNRAHPRDDQRQRIRLPCYARIVSSWPVVLNSEPRNITLRLLNIYIYISFYTCTEYIHLIFIFLPSTSTIFFFNDKSDYSSNPIFRIIRRKIIIRGIEIFPANNINGYRFKRDKLNFSSG